MSLAEREDMKVTQTIQLSEAERLAIQKVLGLCDEISEIAHCTMVNVFQYFEDVSEIVGEYEYSIGDILQISEIG